ncbi:MAG: hypothetical protein Q7J06_05985 [Bacteroidales bacterium]|nr:hypothetical protein [Bacteroidales bacterium]
MKKLKSTFALFFGNRGFFPESLIAEARKEVSETLKRLEYEFIIMDKNLTRFGAVESPEEGGKYAKFLDENRGKFDGVILVLPNFGDETGAVSALQDAGVPIFILAYPDELDKMGFHQRRDAFCGKFSIMDVCNAITMYALNLASGKPATCLDWNNNYGDDPDKCILFHCGPVPQSLMAAKGNVIDHPMFAKALGAGCGFGCNVGRIAPNKITFASSKTEGGKLHIYMGEGEFTSDPIQDGFFGCGGVAKIDRLQERLYKIGYTGYRHHVSVTPGMVSVALREACTRYLGYEITEI